MVAVAIYSADPAFRLRLEQLLRAELGYTVASVTNDPAAVSQLIEQRRVDTVVAHVPSRKLLTEWRNRHPATTFVVIAGETDEGERALRRRQCHPAALGREHRDRHRDRYGKPRPGTSAASRS